MRIQGLSANQYGQYDSFVLTKEHFSAPLTVIYGPNEAGKSTLHSLIRSALFGFRGRGSLAQSYSTESTVVNLTLLEASGATLSIERSCPPKNGRVRIYMNEFQEEGEAAVQKRLGGITPTLFSHIFCFSHQELQLLETLQGEEISAYLHSAAMGAGGMSLLDAEKKMLKQQELLFKPRATNPELNRLLQELEQQRATILSLEKKIGRYQPVQEELEKAQEKLQRDRELSRKLDRKRAFYDLMLQAFDLLQKCKQLEAVLASGEQDELSVLPYEAELYALQMEGLVMREKQQELGRMASQLEQLDHQVELSLERLGPSWSLEKVRRLDLSVSAKQELLQTIQEAEAKKRKLDTLQDKALEKREAAIRAERKWKDLEENVLGLEQQANRGQEKSGSQYAKLQKKNRAVLLGLAGGGLAIAIILWLQGHTLEGLAVGTSIMVAAFLLLQWVARADQEKESWQAYLQKQEELISQQNLMLVSARQEAEALQIEARETEEQGRVCEQELHSIYEGGRALLAGWEIETIHGLIQAQHMLHVLEKIQEDTLEKKRLSQRKAELEQEIMSWELRVEALAQALRLEQRSGRIVGPALLEWLHKRLQEELEQESKKREQQNRLAEWRAELDALYSQLTQLAAAVSSSTLTATATTATATATSTITASSSAVPPVPTVPAVPEVSASVSEQSLIGNDRQQLEAQLWQSTRVELEEKAQEVTASYQQVLEGLEQQALQIGNLEQELKQLEREDTLANLQQEYEQQKALFRDKAKQWLTYSAARALCEKTRKIYEEERQPAVLKQASYFFAAFTEQRYEQIIVPLGEKELVAVDRQGKRWLSSKLSKGTKEQLYLAMRFALIKAYEKQAILPVIMDDPFVHFDQDRLSEVFKGILELANTHQVILFTCHQHYAKLLQDAAMQEQVQFIDLEQCKRVAMI